VKNSKSLESEISSAYSSLGDSSLSRLDVGNSYKEKYSTATTKSAQNLGMSSLMLQSPNPVTGPSVVPKTSKSTNSNNLQTSHRLTSKSIRPQSKNETPLLNNLLLQHSARF